MDGGKAMKLSDTGEVLNANREIIVVDRANDPQLRNIIEFIKKQTRGMNEKEKAQYLMDYIYNLAGDGNSAVVNLHAVERAGVKMKLGDIMTQNPPIAVCRHRSLLYKVLGDEIGLDVQLQRGRFYQNAENQGGHAWNTVQFKDGSSAIYDAMNNRRLSTDFGNVDDFALYYRDVNNAKLYENGLETAPKQDVFVEPNNTQNRQFNSIAQRISKANSLSEIESLQAELNTLPNCKLKQSIQRQLTNKRESMSSEDVIIRYEADGRLRVSKPDDYIDDLNNVVLIEDALQAEPAELAGAPEFNIGESADLGEGFGELHINEPEPDLFNPYEDPLYGGADDYIDPFGF